MFNYSAHAQNTSEFSPRLGFIASIATVVSLDVGTEALRTDLHLFFFFSNAECNFKTLREATDPPQVCPINDWPATTQDDGLISLWVIWKIMMIVRTTCSFLASPITGPDAERHLVRKSNIIVFYVCTTGGTHSLVQSV